MNTSIIVPMYNEEKRITPFLTNLIKFSEKKLKDYEIILVNDGSKDNTDKVVKGIIKNNKNIRLISYKPNGGKGNAVKVGFKNARGKKVLFIDADGSIQPDEIPRMIEKLDKYDVVVGNRYAKESKVKRHWLRAVYSFFFNTIVKILFQSRVRDNLCGFKGFKKNIADNLFNDLIDKRWVFDVELFFKIKKKSYSLYELPIKWVHVGGSQVKMFSDPVKWFLRLIILRIKLFNMP